MVYDHGDDNETLKIKKIIIARCIWLFKCIITFLET